ncbi:uncharacterized protein [Pseudochaenichthys georgianus]|uniref:uncharacterized protein n=1 Tax=Pseudochaenichthys georgianus TaxID=52239 RepID=UPI0039C10880
MVEAALAPPPPPPPPQQQGVLGSQAPPSLRLVAPPPQGREARPVPGAPAVAPPPAPPKYSQRPYFLWAPYKRWKYHLKCPSCAHKMTDGGLYKTVRRVLDLDGWYYMGTEYLECSYQEQMHQQPFVSQLVCERQEAAGPRPPAVLTYRLSCDRKVLAQMKGLRSFLVEQHTAEWMRRSIPYLHTCRRVEVAGVQMPPPQPPPQMVPVPSSGWLLSTYVLESFTRIEELKAKATSTFGSILKMDSTKKA